MEQSNVIDNTKNSICVQKLPRMKEMTDEFLLTCLPFCLHSSGVTRASILDTEIPKCLDHYKLICTHDQQIRFDPNVTRRIPGPVWAEQ